MKIISTLPYLALIIILTAFESCEGIKQSSKYGLTEGYYSGNSAGRPKVPVYVFPDDDSIKVYHRATAQRIGSDSGRSLLLSFPATFQTGVPKDYFIKQHTLDIDVLSILLKYRPPTKGFPPQLNTSILNGALFVGYRTDIYKITYKPAPFGLNRRSVTHYGFSFGMFTGIGASRIDPFVTQGILNIEYDGVVNPSGIAAIIAVDKLTFGLTAGVDHLLDKNHSFWIYQGKPWLGLSVGLNLN